MNKEIRTLTISSILAIVIMFLSYFQWFVFEHFPVSATGMILMAIISGVVGVRLLSREDRDENILNFGIFFSLFSIFQLFLFIPHVSLFFPHSEDHIVFTEMMRWGYIVGHVFLFASLAVFIRIPLSFIREKWKNAGSAVFVGLGTLTTVLSAANPLDLLFDHSVGITVFNVDPTVGALIALNAFLAWIPAGIFFLYLGLKSKDRFLRRRGVLLGIGLITTTIGGPLHAVPEPAILFIAETVTLLGITILACGVFYEIDKTKQ